ncbi:hypothetical protein OHU11_41945 (plasmid) [Streptomyces sp. NBC_00257]|uniref:hypothetical protein n=1 Tax=unclassified Streptomyces TaxID=2593676 RepID=UPI00224FF696|nr:MULTISPECIES: hypothetical protein [unclassified Streptomyces]MCX5434743.1 hypothetical protein [Streptomyces sp. NBC_00062]
MTSPLNSAANETVRGANVRALHVLVPACVKASPTAAATPAGQSAAPAVPVERRTPPDGYRCAIEAHRQATGRPARAPAQGGGLGHRGLAARRDSSRIAAVCRWTACVMSRDDRARPDRPSSHPTPKGVSPTSARTW